MKTFNCNVFFQHQERKLKRHLGFLSFLILFSGQILCAQTYCIPVSDGCEYGDYINDFILYNGGINHTGSGCSVDGYGDFTDDINLKGILYKGQNYDFDVTFEFPGQSLKIWIDFNGNGDFEDDGELLFDSSYDFYDEIITGSIQIPIDAPVTENTRLRAILQYNVPPPHSCFLEDFGETHDYTVAILSVPDCTEPSELNYNTLPSLTSVELSWFGEETNYEIEWGELGFVQGLGTITTTITNDLILIDLTPNTSYQYYVRRICDEEMSIWVGPSIFYTDYCNSFTTDISDFISSFVTQGGINNINNITTGIVSPNGYNDFTNLIASHFGNQEVDFIVTNSNAIMGVNIWVDWNKNLKFEENEKVYTSGVTGSGPFTGSFAIPQGTDFGDYRIRVRAMNLANPSACGYIYAGETEDYTLRVVENASCLYPTNLSAQTVSLNSVEISWESTENTFEVKYGLSDFNLEDGILIAGLTSDNIILSDLETSTYYHYYVRASCGDDQFSPWVGPYLFLTGYCESISYYDSYQIVSFITAGGVPFNISNISSESINGYSDYTDLFVQNYQTGNIDFTVTTNNNVGMNIWVDWNNDLEFSENEKVYTSSSFGTVFSDSFMIPEGAPTGDYRIRIRVERNNIDPNPCGNVNYGETEDYTLRVIDTPSCMPVFFPAVTNISNVSVYLEWEAEGESFDIEYGPSGFVPGEGLTVSGVGNPYILSGLTHGTVYDYYVRQNCGIEDGYSIWNGPVTFTKRGYEGNISTLFNENPQVDDTACITLFSIEVPEGQYLSALNVKYSMISHGVAWTSQQRSILYSPTLGEGENQVFVGETDFPGISNYNRNVTFANGATGIIDFELKAWRTEWGTECNTDYIYIIDGSWILTPLFEDIPNCPSPVTNLSYTNITEDSVDLTWTAEIGIFQVKWGISGFNIETAGTLISDINTNSHNLSDLDSSIVYDFYVRRDCSIEDGESYGDWVGPFKFNTGYCIPSSSLVYFLTQFSTTDAIENIVYSSTGIDLGTGYKDRTDLIVTQNTGEVFNFSSNYPAGASGLRIWIDWNNNFIFEDEEEVFYLVNASGSKSGTITIPFDVINGDYRMRVRVQQGTTPYLISCGNIDSGEAIDFVLRVEGEVNSTFDFNKFAFSYYPNPVQDILQMKANTEINEVVIFNMLGQQLSLPVKSNNTQIDMTGLPSGNYLMSITIEGINKTFKIVK